MPSNHPYRAEHKGYTKVIDGTQKLSCKSCSAVNTSVELGNDRLQRQCANNVAVCSPAVI